MKILKSIIVIFAISLTTSFSSFAIDKNPEEPNPKLRAEIVSLLADKTGLKLEESGKAEISFMVNNSNELIIVSVDSNIPCFDYYVKTKLNYKKVSTKGIMKGEVYIIPIKFISELANK